MSNAITVIHYLNVIVELEVAFVSTFTFDRVWLFSLSTCSLFVRFLTTLKEQKKYMVAAIT